MVQQQALSVVHLNLWLLRYVLTIHLSEPKLTVADLAGQEVWPSCRLVGIWCAHLSNVAPAISFPW